MKTAFIWIAPWTVVIFMTRACLHYRLTSNATQGIPAAMIAAAIGYPWMFWVKCSNQREKLGSVKRYPRFLRRKGWRSSMAIPPLAKKLRWSVGSPNSRKPCAKGPRYSPARY